MLFFGQLLSPKATVHPIQRKTHTIVIILVMSPGEAAHVQDSVYNFEHC